MAGIQQSINQMLYTGTVGAGLYAHSPEGQKQAQIKTLENRIKGIEKKALIEGEGDIRPEYYKQMGELEEQKFNLNPKQKYFKKAISYYEKELDARLRIEKRIKERRNEKDIMKLNEKILGGNENGK